MNNGEMYKVGNTNNITMAKVGDSLFSRDTRLKWLEDNSPRIYSCQSRSIFFTRPFVTGHSLVLRFGAPRAVPSLNDTRTANNKSDVKGRLLISC